MRNRLANIFFLIATLGSCKNTGGDYQKIEGNAQGTNYIITFEAKEGTFNKSEVDSIFKAIDHSMSLWDSTSIISNVNKGATSLLIDDHFKNVLQKSYEIYYQSSGAFDPSIGPLIKAWGFIRKNDLPLPTDHTIDSLKQFTGLEKVSLHQNRVVKENPAVELDFNGIAQGYTVDVIAAHLEKTGIANYLIELGGEVRAKGKNEEGQSWKIGIEKPTQNESAEQNEVQSVVALHNMSLTTAGNYRNFIQTNGKFLSHILDPKTGKPVEHRVVSVSVLASTCMEADGWDTAFLVLGKEKSIELATKLGLDFQMILIGKKNNYEVFQTEGFRKMIQ